MIANLLDDWFKLDVGEGAFDAVFGFLFVFLGIVLLVLFFTLLGFIMKKVNAKPRRKKAPKAQKGQKANPEAPSVAVGEGVSPELVAVITAAVACFYEGENVKCDFVVKRIKKL